MKNNISLILKISIVSISIVLSFVSIFYNKQNVNADCINNKTYGYNICAKIKTFSDTSKNEYLEAIKYAQRNKIVQGYEDGTFKPDNPINRAEFTKVLVEAVLGKTPSAPTETCFPDVKKGVWFEKYVCYGKGKLFDGYPDGTFQAGNNINFSEASKILSKAFDLAVPSSKSNEPWYGKYISAISKKNVIPRSIQTHYQFITRGEMVEMIMRLNEKQTNKPSLKDCDFVIERCKNNSGFIGYGDSFLSEKKINMEEVRIAWLAWYNNVRKENGLSEYKYNNNLNRSAYIWSKFSADRGEMSHKRIGQTEYYDYKMITDWFGSLGLEFENINSVTHTENIGAGSFNCKQNDCTQDLIKNIKNTFDFYMSEKNKKYRPHYNSVMNKYFKEIGLGIAIDSSENKYYLTVHYGTRLK